MKKVIVTLASGPHQAYVDMTRSRLIEYAEKHNYDVEIFNEVLTTERPPAWSKILIIQKMLKTYDFVLWIDSDAVIVDLSADIFNEIDPGRTDLALVEHNYESHSVGNAGVMLIRRTESMLDFLELVWNQVDLIDHPWWENAAILRCLGFDSELVPIGPGDIESRILIEVKFLDKEWNAIRQDYPHDNVKIRHFAGEPSYIRTFLIASLTLDNPSSQEAFQFRAHQIAQMDTTIAERDSAVAERDLMLNSKSWKLTKPIRGLHKRFFTRMGKN
jgi:hypothetical protein